MDSANNGAGRLGGGIGPTTYGSPPVGMDGANNGAGRLRGGYRANDLRVTSQVGTTLESGGITSHAPNRAAVTVPTSQSESRPK